MELAAERRALKEYIEGDPLLRRFFDVFLFEDLPASDRRADDVYLDEVDRCGIYLGLFGNEYGYEDGKPHRSVLRNPRIAEALFLRKCYGERVASNPGQDALATGGCSDRKHSMLVCLHVSPQYRIDLCLVVLLLVLEPIQNIGIQSD
jgi:hypothetical protein